MESQIDIVIWVRPEDADHPKLDRLRRAVTVAIGPTEGVRYPWVVWAAGLSRSWLVEKLEVGGQVLIMPPWTEGGFAGLPPVRLTTAPNNELLLRDDSYTVGASNGIDPSPAWQEHGLFRNSKLAWLVSHEPFVGAGQAWLTTAELLVASPATRPREARQLTADIMAYLTSFCRAARGTPGAQSVQMEGQTIEFAADDVPYLLAAIGLPSTTDKTQAAQFMSRRLGVEPDLGRIERILTHPSVSADLTQPIGSRPQIATVLDSLGYRSFRLEIEETRHE